MMDQKKRAISSIAGYRRYGEGTKGFDIGRDRIMIGVGTMFLFCVLVNFGCGFLLKGSSTTPA